MPSATAVGSLLRRYINGLDAISVTAGNKTGYFHYDGLGSVVNMTSSSGATWWTYSYLPFGGVRTETKGNNQAIDNQLRFAGEYLDPTGLYYLRARQYDPGTGRFVSTDPAKPRVEDPYLSTYIYAKNNPVRLVDPSGRDTGALCISVQAGFILFGGEMICLQASDIGELGITATTEYGGGSPTLSLTGEFQQSTATSIEDLAGLFGFAGGSGGEGIVAGGGAFWGTDGCGGSVTGLNGGAGLGAEGLPFVEGHFGASETNVLVNLDIGALFGRPPPTCPTRTTAK